MKFIKKNVNITSRNNEINLPANIVTASKRMLSKSVKHAVNEI